ncbi:putative tetratricopeptide-like helical domain superfamily [Helianthus annuus]|nr:putative tetratricopeptide-like helical domain superfamily [Helianthus annuus]KAJ0517504.1 putative tetratricopeptide-like helical domain superfamily [Helianthus annuus]KAJ0685514.1 putative tetratricopeptide-like helical domain superfamily [Helianthus annuus]
MVSGFQLFARSERQLASPLDKLLRRSLRVKSLKSIKSVHGFITTMGSNLPQSAFFHNKLISVYTSLGYISVARKVFDEMPHKNVVSYNTMISTYSRDENIEQAWSLFSEMRNFGFFPTQFTYGSLFSCNSLNVVQGLYMQAVAMKSGFLFADSFVGTASLGFFGRQGCINGAFKVFDEMPFKNLVTYNAMISLFGHEGFVHECMLMFRELLKSHISLSEPSFVGVLSGFRSEEDLDSGEQLHGLVIKFGLLSKVSVANSLVNMYGKCAGTYLTEKMFRLVPNRDLVTWNTVIGALANGKEPIKAIEFFCRMYIDGFLPNRTTFLSAITSCTRLSNLTYGEFIHAKIIKNRYENDGFVRSSLVNFYAKCNRLDSAHCCFDEILDKNLVCWNALLHGYSNRSCSTSVLLLQEMIHSAQELFCEVEDPDIVSWNILIAACSRNGDYKEAFELFQHMQMDRITPDSYTYVSLLSICTNLCNLVFGSLLHSLMIKSDFSRCDIMVRNVMIDMYGKCGSLLSAVKVFDEMLERNVISWTALVSALGLHGHGKEALQRFKQMEIDGIQPDKVAFIAVLSACRHGGLVKDGMEMFEKMKEKYAIEPEMEHYLLVVDLMARYGDLKEAEKLISGMPFTPNASIWRSFLDGCNRQRNIEHLSLQIQAC